MRQRTERKLLVDARADDVGVDDETVGHVVQGEEDGISEQELGGWLAYEVLGAGELGPTISGMSMRRMAPVFVS